MAATRSNIEMVKELITIIGDRCIKIHNSKINKYDIKRIFVSRETVRIQDVNNNGETDFTNLISNDDAYIKHVYNEIKNGSYSDWDRLDFLKEIIKLENNSVFCLINEMFDAGGVRMIKYMKGEIIKGLFYIKFLDLRKNIITKQNVYDLSDSTISVLENMKDGNYL